MVLSGKEAPKEILNSISLSKLIKYYNQAKASSSGKVREEELEAREDSEGDRAPGQGRDNPQSPPLEIIQYFRSVSPTAACTLMAWNGPFYWN